MCTAAAFDDIARFSGFCGTVQSNDSFMAGIPNTVRLTAQIVGSIATEDP